METTSAAHDIPTCAPEPSSLYLDLIPIEDVFGTIPEVDPNIHYSAVNLETEGVPTTIASTSEVGFISASDVPTCVPEPASLCIDLVPIEEVYGPIPKLDPNSLSMIANFEANDGVPTRAPSPRALHIKLEIAESVPSADPEPRYLILDLVPSEESDDLTLTPAPISNASVERATRNFHASMRPVDVRDVMPAMLGIQTLVEGIDPVVEYVPLNFNYIGIHRLTMLSPVLLLFMDWMGMPLALGRTR